MDANGYYYLNIAGEVGHRLRATLQVCIHCLSRDDLALAGLGNNDAVLPKTLNRCTCGLFFQSITCDVPSSVVEIHDLYATVSVCRDRVRTATIVISKGLARFTRVL